MNSHGTEDGVDWRGAEGKDLKPIQFRWWEETKLRPQGRCISLFNFSEIWGLITISAENRQVIPSGSGIQTVAKTVSAR